MQLTERVIGVLEGVKTSIQQTMEEKKINASGRTSASIKVEKEGDNIFRLVAGVNDGGDYKIRTAPFKTIEIGRGPGGDYKKLRGAIYQWTIDKGWSFELDTYRWGTATNIAKKIVAQGTERYSHHEDVYTSAVTKAKEDLTEMLMESVDEQLRFAIENFNVVAKTNKI